MLRGAAGVWATLFVLYVFYSAIVEHGELESSCAPLRVDAASVKCVGPHRHVCSYTILKPAKVQCRPHLEPNNELNVTSDTHWTCRSRTHPWIRSMRLHCADPCTPTPACYVSYSPSLLYRTICAVLFTLGLSAVIGILCVGKVYFTWRYRHPASSADLLRLFPRHHHHM